jgi:hypothetical protein
MKSRWVFRIQISIWLNCFLLSASVAADWWIPTSGYRWFEHPNLLIQTERTDRQDQLITATLCEPKKNDKNEESRGNLKTCIVPEGKRVLRIYLYQMGLDLCRQWEGIDSFRHQDEAIQRWVNHKIETDLISAESMIEKIGMNFRAWSGDQTGKKWDPCAPLNRTEKVISDVNSLRIDESLSLLVKPRNPKAFYTYGTPQVSAIDRFALYFLQKLYLEEDVRREFDRPLFSGSGPAYTRKNELFSRPQKHGERQTAEALLILKNDGR